MGVTEKHVSNYMRRVSLNDLIESIRPPRESILALPAGGHMAHDPYPLAFVLSFLKLFDEKGENSRVVWVVSM